MENNNPNMPPPVQPQGNPYGQNPYQQAPGGYQQHAGMGMQMDHPKASTIYSLGIIGLVLTFLAGIIGLILNIINLAIASGVMKDINSNPGRYSEASVKKIRSGRTCSIVGLSIQGAVVLILILVLVAAS